MAEAHAFGRYRVTGTLGAGAMGEVFAAVDEVLGREVAVKTLRGKHEGLAARLLDERFRQEARAIAALAHPGVVQVFDIDLNAEVPYIVMERVAGPSLKERLLAGPLDVNELRALGIQVGRALAAAHAAGIVHRDVKPANILTASTAVGGASTWKLADFGVAHVPDSSLTMTGQFVGSPAYAPPEALVRGQTGPAGDVYGLGATLFEAACGRWPRSDNTTGALLAPAPPLHLLASHLPPDLAAVIDRAVALEPEERPSAAQLADAIAGASSVSGAASAVSVPDRSPPAAMASGAFGVPGRGIRWWHIAMIVGIIVVIGVIVAIATRRPSTATPSKPPTTTDGSGKSGSSKPGRPDELNVRTPEIAKEHPRAGKDWRKVVEKLEQQKFGEARKKLSEFENRWGDSEETRSLREQMKAIPMVPDKE